MNTPSANEQLSAFLDEELGFNESLALMKRLQSESELSAKLHRFAVAKEVMRSGQSLIPDAGFVGRIHDAIAEEPIVLAPRAIRSKLREKAATLALAASIAMLAVLVGRSVNQYSPIKGSELLAQAELSAPAVQASMEPDLRDYLNLHNESAYLSGSQGMLPSIRLVSHSASR
jgi:sigma-E factor negative regulatory protein RseA